MNPYHFFSKSEKNKAMLVISLVVIALASAFFYEGNRLHSRTIDQVTLKKEKSIDLTVKDISLYSLAPYVQRLSNLLATHKEIPKALMEQDRDTLYRLTLHPYEALKRENKYLHVMHFHLPDGRSFLRMHSPENFGDDLREIRPAVQYVHQRRTPLTCYEIGIYGAFYRIILPVFHQGSYAGALELGINVHTFLESLQKQITDPLTTFYMTDRWQKVTTPQDNEFLVFGEYTLNTHNDPLYKHLPQDLDLLRDNQRLTINGNSYLLHTYPIFNDFQEKPLGGFVVMQDLSEELTARKVFIFQSLFFAAILLAISLIVLYLTFGKLIGKLESSESSLRKTVKKLSLEVDERKQTAKQLSESKKEWERTFDAIGDIVTIMNSKFEIIKANHAAHKILNAEPGTLNGKFCYEVFGNRSSACDSCPGLDTIKNCQVNSSEIKHQNLGKTFLITTSPVPDEKGEYTHIVHIAKDITELKELETQLRQAQKMEAIGTLAGGIAHDFNNILTATIGFTELALLEAKDGGKITEHLKQVKNASDRAKDLVTQILTFSRQTEHEKRPLQVSLIIKEALKLLRSSIPTTIEIKENIISKGSILADPTQVHQIIMNLSTNAYHSMMETGGVLGISLQDVTIDKKGMIGELEITPGQYVCLEVCDTGCGMDEKTKDKIFDPYFTTKEVGKGTGLGLAVVHGIVTGCNGYINIYSEPDQGTTFHVYLPTVKDEPVDYLPQASKEVARGGSERIMFIDDEEVIVVLVSEILRTYGYKITIFKNGVQAVQDFEKHPEDFDLVITDMSMPYMTGLQVTQKIKEIRSDLPIVLCSGYSETIYKEKALAMGVSRYIQKPLQMDKLAKVIRELLDIAS